MGSSFVFYMIVPNRSNLDLLVALILLLLPVLGFRVFQLYPLSTVLYTMESISHTRALGGP
jgi:hypothetical protein